MRRLLTPLSRLFEGATRIRRRLYERGTLRSYQLDGPVVSVGNLSLGGTGKTPAVAYLAQKARNRGMTPVILSRGYGGSAESSSLLACDGDGPLCRPSDCGDEPYLLARLVPFATILVGKDRRSAAQRFKGRFENPLFLLDDGFQHFRLRRQADLLLIDGTRPFGSGSVLPAGTLREPKSAMARADALLITRTHQLENGALDLLEKELRRWNPSAPIFHFDQLPEIAYELTRRKHHPLRSLAGKKFVALAALGNPRQFVRDLVDLGIDIRDSVFFRDHHPYSQQDLEKVMARAAKLDCEGVLTNEKDAVRLAELELPPDLIYVVRVRMRCRQEEEFDAWLAPRIETGAPSG